MNSVQYSIKYQMQIYSLNVKRVERVEIHSKRSEASERRTTRFRVDKFFHSIGLMSVKVKFSPWKEWNIVIKNPFSLVLECALKNVFTFV